MKIIAWIVLISAIIITIPFFIIISIWLVIEWAINTIEVKN